MNKRKVLSIDGKVKAIREIENGKKKAGVCREFGLLNYGDPSDLEKQNQNYLCV